MILRGLKGTRINMPAVGAPITLVDCQLLDLDHYDLVGRKKIPLEAPGQVVIHFSSTIAATFIPVRVEWGSGGSSQSVDLPAYNGLSLPICGSWFRVSAIPFAGFAGAIGAFAAIGHVSDAIIPVLGPTAVAAGGAASLSLGTGITGAGVALPLTALIGFIKEIKIYRNPAIAFTAAGLIAASPFNFWNIDVAAQADCPWIATAGCFSPVPPNSQFDVQNNGAVAADFSAMGRLSL